MLYASSVGSSGPIVSTRIPNAHSHTRKKCFTVRILGRCKTAIFARIHYSRSWSAEGRCINSQGISSARHLSGKGTESHAGGGLGLGRGQEDSIRRETEVFVSSWYVSISFKDHRSFSFYQHLFKSQATSIQRLSIHNAMQITGT